TELRATLAAARVAYPKRRIVAAFQPHRYTRVRDHLEEFAASLDEADLVVLTPIYPAGEAPIVGIDSERLADLVRARKPGREVLLVGRDGDPVVATTLLLCECCRSDDLTLTLGAGS